MPTWPDVLPTNVVRATLNKITASFDAGEVAPVIFGSHRRPQAVLLSWRAWNDLQDSLGRAKPSDPAAAGDGSSARHAVDTERSHIR